MIVAENYQLGWLTEVLQIGNTAASIYAQKEAQEAAEDALKAQKQILETQKEIELIKANTAEKAIVAAASAQPKDNTMLYVGLGVGVLALGGLGFMMMKKK